MATRLLVIDDSQTIRKLVELSCRALSFALEFAASGAEGLSLARANPPELVLLDLVLPDMKGLEVCQQLLRDPRTSQVMVLLMSAKDEAAVRPEVHGRVAGFLHKPFTAKDLVQKLEHARDQSSQAAVIERSPDIPFERKERLAQVLYARLKAPLASMPEWVSQLGAAQPASFIARKLLTPELIDDLVRDLNAALGTSSSAVPDAAANGDAPLCGTVDGFPVLDLLRVVAGHERTGVLELRVRSQRVWLSWRSGVLLLVTTDAVERYLRGAEGELAGVSTDDRSRAETEQARTGKPVFVSLAESGRLPSGKLSQLLFRQGKSVLMETLDEPKCSFAWRDALSLPTYVEAQGRQIAFAQIHLERMRREPAMVVEAVADSLGWVFERSPGFSQRLRQLELSQEERRVLTLIDGRHPVSHVIQRSSMSPALVSAVLRRFVALELIRRIERSSAGKRHVVLIDPDEVGVRRPLERLLNRRREPIELVVFRHDEPELISHVVKHWPAMLIANASALGEAAHALARELVNSPQGLDTSLVAILEERDSEVADQLLAAGFDAVFPKPVLFGDLDQLLKG